MHAALVDEGEEFLLGFVSGGDPNDIAFVVDRGSHIHDGAGGIGVAFAAGAGSILAFFCEVDVVKLGEVFAEAFILRVEDDNAVLVGEVTFGGDCAFILYEDLRFKFVLADFAVGGGESG